MKFFKKTSVLVTTTRRLVVHSSQTDEIVQCPRCVEQMMAAHAAAELFGVSNREIFRLIEAGTIHFVETENNRMFVCPRSIRQVLESPETISPNHPALIITSDNSI